MDALDIARFWSGVEVGFHTACWPWRKFINDQGYGEIKVDGKAKAAHRIAFEIVAGPLPENAVLRHKCDTAACCNPTHLESGTHADNVRDRVLRGRSAKGEKNAKAKLTEAQVREILKLSYYPAIAIANRYHVTDGTIRAIWERRTWKHLS